MCCFLVLVLCVSFSNSNAEDGVALFESGKFDEARTAFEAMLTAQPGDPVALYYLGLLTPEGAKSRDYLKRMLDKHPQHELADDALFELAEADFAQGLYVTARGKYRQLLNTYENSNRVGMALYRVGLTFLAIHQADSALVVFDLAQNGRDEGAQMHARLGRLEALVQLDRKSEAIREAKQWLAEGAGELDGDARAFVARIAPGESLPQPTVAKPIQAQYWIRVGIYRQDRYLTYWDKKLRDQTYRTFIEKNEDQKVLYVGPYATRDAAKRDQVKINKLIKSKTVVTER